MCIILGRCSPLGHREAVAIVSGSQNLVHSASNRLVVEPREVDDLVPHLREFWAGEPLPRRVRATIPRDGSHGSGIVAPASASNPGSPHRGFLVGTRHVRLVPLIQVPWSNTAIRRARRDSSTKVRLHLCPAKYTKTEGWRKGIPI